MNMVKINNLYKKFENKTIFSDFNLEISTGEFVALSGGSGSGKTTLINMIGGLETFGSGSIYIDDIEVKTGKKKISFFRNKVGFLFQNYGLIENKTVQQNLNIVKKSGRSGIKMEEALVSVGLEGYEKKQVYKLSGGEQQRVAIARLIMKKCDIILADEPTGSLDRKNAEAVVEILKKFSREKNITIIMATHDEFIKSMADRVILIGEIK